MNGHWQLGGVGASMFWCVSLLFGGQADSSAGDVTSVEQAIEAGNYAQAYAEAVNLAEAGDELAAALAGALCTPDDSIYCPPEQAIRWLAAPARGGSAEAQYALGMAHARLTPPDTNASLEWLLKAASAGHASALFAVGTMKIGIDDKSGFLYLLGAAEKGHTEAQYILATLYENSIFVKKNDTEALRWYRQAAEAGHPIAQTRLGVFYELGRGVPVNAELTDRWYRKAAETGHQEAQFRLGMLYMLGDAVEQDPYEGIFWLEKAAQAGYAKAQDQMGRAYYQGVGVAKDVSEALRWFIRAAESGLPVAMLNAGLLYENDFRLNDPAAARIWYRRAADSADATVAATAKKRLRDVQSASRRSISAFGDDVDPDSGAKVAAVAIGLALIALAVSSDNGSGSDGNFRRELDARDAEQARQRWNQQHNDTMRDWAINILDGNP